LRSGKRGNDDLWDEPSDRDNIQNGHQEQDVNWRLIHLQLCHWLISITITIRKKIFFMVQSWKEIFLGNWGLSKKARKSRFNVFVCILWEECNFYWAIIVNILFFVFGCKVYYIAITNLSNLFQPTMSIFFIFSGKAWKSLALASWQKVKS